MKTKKMAAVVGLAAICGSAGLAEAQMRMQAQSISCETPYEVREGDTLREIGRAAYGRGAPIQILFSANREAIGENAAQLRAGTILEIPCLEGWSSPAPVQAQALPPVEDNVDQVSQPQAAEALSLRVVAAPDWRPFMDETAPGGGMFPHLIAEALAATVSGDRLRVDFVSDRGAHLDPLTADGMFDLTLALAGPDCGAAGVRDAQSNLRCGRLAWSDPIFEATMRMYVRPHAVAATRSAFVGRTICVAEGDARLALVALALTEGDVELRRAGGADDCAMQVASGEVFAAFAPQRLMDAAVRAAGLSGAIEASLIVDAPHLFHAVVAANHPKRTAILARINRGLEIIRLNGRWFEIVQEHLIRSAAPRFSRSEGPRIAKSG